MNQTHESQHQQTMATPSNQAKPFVRIIEQPAKCAIRFRYECEGRSAGSIPGVNSTQENKSYPTIQVCNYRGKAVVVVSCVTKDQPYRPHPHNLVGKEGCKKGVCTIVIADNNPEMTCTFTSLGIQCVKRKDIEESLKLREMIKVDPFRTGFSHRSQASSIDLNVVRLCFQVFVEGPEKGKFTVQLLPVVSEPIYDKKAMAELIITKLSHYAAPCTGGKEIILLCDRVAKDDIQVRFFNESTEKGLLWEGYGEFLPNDVHKQVAISLRTPKYYDESIQQPVTVQIQLRRPSDGCVSLPRSFQLTPRELDPDGLVRKRHKRLNEENYELLQEYIQLSTNRNSPKNEIPSIQNQMQHNVSATMSSFSSNRPYFGQIQPKQEPNVSPKSPLQFAPVSNSIQPMMYASGSEQLMVDQKPQVTLQPMASSSSPIPSPNSNNQAKRHIDMSNSSQYTSTVALTDTNFAFISSSPSNYQHQYSPNPSIASYSSVSSPGTAANYVNSPNINLDNMPPHGMQNQTELPNEVMQRFDSLDIDSSELIPDLDFNSNTMLNLMMDTSSGLSLTDSFSDVTNNNNQNKSKISHNNISQSADGMISGNSNNNKNCDNRNRARLKLNVGSNASNSTEFLDTPNIEMSNSFPCGMNGPVDPLLSVLDVDNNNII